MAKRCACSMSFGREQVRQQCWQVQRVDHSDPRFAWCMAKRAKQLDVGDTHWRHSYR